MLSINTNLSSLIAQNSLKSSTDILNLAVERMTTGYKINHAKDNAANYSISTNMTTKINSYMVAEDNCAMGLDMITTAGENLNLIEAKLQRLRALATQASNGTYGQQSLNAINTEANALVDEINRLYQTAEYNGMSLFKSNDVTPTNYRVYSDEEIAEMTSISDVSSFTSGECYSISTPEELAKLAQMTNSNVDTSGVTFVLANDIDLKVWCDAHTTDGGWTPINNFKGYFNGNCHVISNLTINRPTENYQGLFAKIYNDESSISYLGLEDVSIIAKDNVGGLIGSVEARANYICLHDIYVTGTINGNNNVGGICGEAYNGDIYFECLYTKCLINGNNAIGGIVGSSASQGALSYCYNYSDCTITGNNYVGGLIGRNSACSYIYIFKNYTDCIITGNKYVGGLVGIEDSQWGYTEYECNYTKSLVSGETYVGGFLGAEIVDPAIFTDCATIQTDSYVTQMSEEEISAIYTFEYMEFDETNGWKIVNGCPVFSWQDSAQALSGTNYLELQVGINANEQSNLDVEMGLDLGFVNALREIGINTEYDFISDIDRMLSVVNVKQTVCGAAQNRLESALDEISTQYENLVSSRSTIRDADIAEVSSHYIQQQILQQASATLLATANQAPAIALQLI